MSGVIVSVKGRYAVLLTKNSDFIKVKNKNYSVGDKVKIPQYKGQILAAATSFIVVCGGISSYFVPAKIYVQGGKTYIVSTDDGANAAGDEPTENAITLSSDDIAEFAGPGGFGGGGNQGPNWGGEDSSSYGYLEVSGGLLYIEAEGDGFDSNGDGVITGGIVLVNGPTSGGNGVFDVGDNNNTLTITGGIVIGAGTSDMAVTPTKATNSQYYVVASGSSSSGGGGGFGGHSSSSSSSGFSTQATGKAFKLTDSSGNEIVTYVPSKQYSWVLVSTPEMSSGTYTLNYGGSVTGGTFTNGNYGLVTDGAYSGSSTISLSAKQ